jgi:3-isopropylmalate dehydrogenase
LPTDRLGLLREDGIGPEIVDATLHVLGAAEQRQPHPDFAALEGCDAWLLGPHDSPSYPESERAKLNPSGELRRRFDL